MVKELIHDPLFLGIKSKPATKEDKIVGRDLLDTLTAHRDSCVGMAANMIGVTKCIIAFSDNGKFTLMYNPQIVGKSGSYQTQEGCLSLLGGPRLVTRFKTIRVKFQDKTFSWKTASYTGFTAQIIQHEIDHCNGILI
ncbi:MAG: peptide deformylase [Ruminococcus sp.]|nr:peptide deformylase [Ruminococcus sp.]MBR0303704.1 peptide deformylase [Clostridia bacterium]